MADDQHLHIGVSASVDGLKKGLQEAGKEVDKFADKTEDASKKTEDLGKKGQTAAPALGELGKAMEKIGGEVGQAGSKLSSFSQAMTKLRGALAGIAPAGAGAIIALGAIGGLLAAGAIIIYKNRDAILEYVAGINDITKAFDEASGEIGTQIGKLTQLTEAYQDSNTSQEEKARIMDQLQKDYPAYFGDLTDEADNVEAVKKAYDKQKESIIGLGIIKALEAKKAPLYAKIAELGLKTELSLIDKIGLALQNVKSSVPGAGLLGDAILGDGVSDIEGELAKIDAAIGKIDEKYDVDLADKLGLDKLKKVKRKRVSEITGLPDETEYGAFNKRSKAAFDKIVAGFGESIEDFNGLTTEILPMPPLIDTNQLTLDQQNYNNHLEKMKLALIDFNESMSQIINQQIASTFVGLGQIIGGSLAGAGNFVQDLGKLLLGSLGTVLTQLGIMAIEIGVGILAVKIALQSLNPYVAIAAGVALVALGVFFSQKSQSIGSNMGSSGGGGRSGSSVGGSGGSGFSGSTARSNNSGGGGGTYVFEIEGTKLIGVLSNTVKRNKALGGSLNIG